MSGPRAIVLSPHLDDAVLSCWHVLASADGVTVVNVFAGSPPGSNSIHPWWDRMTGGDDSRRRMEERVAEDREALALAGAEPVNLDFLDDQYRDREQADAPIAEAIRERLPGDVPVYAPAGLGGHVDHLLVRSAALRLAERGVEVNLYADLPHAIAYGWPSWVDGAAHRIDTHHWWEAQLRGVTTGEGRSATPTVHHLDAEAQRGKLEAVLTYRTQLAALDVLFGGLARPGRLEHEVTWSLEKRSDTAGEPSGGAG